MSRVVVAGGAGFIGSWLCRSLLESGHEVTCLDNLGSGRKQNLDGVKVKLIRHDVREPAPEGLEADYVFDLASRASPVDFEKFPLEILLSNSLGACNLLELAKRSGAGFLLASTSEVYGDPLEHPQKETYWGNVNPNGPRSCYDESKRFAESISMTFCRHFGVDVRIARIFNTYGPRMRPDDGRVIPNFIGQALAGKPLTVYGDGSQTRSLCFVSDLVEGLTRLMFAEGLKGEVVNLGNPAEMTMLELAKAIVKLTGSGSKIEFRPMPKDDPARRKPDIGKAKAKLGWQPKVGLEEGLVKTIEHFRTRE